MIPNEIEETELALTDLHKCQERGRYDIGLLDKWLRRLPENIWKAMERLREWSQDIIKHCDELESENAELRRRLRLHGINDKIDVSTEEVRKAS